MIKILFKEDTHYILLQEYYEGSKRSEEMLNHSRKILDKLRKIETI